MSRRQALTFAIVACAGMHLAVAPIDAAGLYFTADGDDLIITAREAVGPSYWSLKVVGGVNPTPAEGFAGSITEFYDLTGDAGSDPALNLARTSAGLLNTRVDGGNLLTAVGTFTAPDFASLTDGVSSYSFTVSHTLFDASTTSDGQATFTSTVTLSAPTAAGTRFNVENHMVTDADWVGDDAHSQDAFTAESILVSYVTAMAGADLVSYDGWADSPRNTLQWAERTATELSTGYAVGRTFLLSETANVETAIGTAGAYHGVVHSNQTTELRQNMSGKFRGSAPTDWEGSASGYLDINIAAVPEPASVCLLAIGGAVMACRRHRSE